MILFVEGKLLLDIFDQMQLISNIIIPKWRIFFVKNPFMLHLIWESWTSKVLSLFRDGDVTIRGNIHGKHCKSSLAKGIGTQLQVKVG